MSRAIVQSTQFAVSLSLNIQVQNGDDIQLVTLSLLSLTSLFFALWSIRESVARFRFELFTLTDDLKAAYSFTSKVLGIGFSSLVFGLGVSL